jgi:hypothetical protein
MISHEIDDLSDDEQFLMSHQKCVYQKRRRARSD